MSKTQPQLEQLYAEIGPMLLAYFRRQPALAGAADDLLQETFARALRAGSGISGAVSPRAYLFGIARHVGLDALRRFRRTEIFDDDIAEEPVAADPRLEMLRLAIVALSAPHREPLLLKLQQELSYEEIAAVLNLPVGTVRSRLHYAVAQLQQALNPARNKPCTPPPPSHESPRA